MSAWLPDMDLNHDKQIQSLLCYRYTIGQTRAFKVGVPGWESRMEEPPRRPRAEIRRPKEGRNLKSEGRSGLTRRREDAKKEGTPETDGKITRRRGGAERVGTAEGKIAFGIAATSHRQSGLENLGVLAALREETTYGG